VARRLPASTAVAKIIITRPLMTFSIGWADFPPQVVAKRWRPKKANANVAMDWRWECLFVVSTKFAFIQIEYRVLGFRLGMKKWLGRIDAIVAPFGQQERPPPLSHRDTRRAGEAQLPVLERL
jgi:hypothetical protein